MRTYYNFPAFASAPTLTRKTFARPPGCEDGPGLVGSGSEGSFFTDG